MTSERNTQKVFLFNRKSLKERPLHLWLDNTASDVVLFTTPDAIKGADFNPYEAFAGVILVDNYSAWNAAIRAEHEAWRHKVSYIASSSETDVLRAARIRERLHLPGQSYASAEAYRDKWVMKTCCQKAGILTPHFSAVNSVIELLQFIETHGFPFVLKPRRSAGSKGVQIIEDKAQLQPLLNSDFLPANRSHHDYWMVESFISAPFFHVDGIMCGGEVLHCWPSQYSIGNADHVKGLAGLQSILLDKDDPQKEILCDLAKQVIATFPATPFATSFHLEAWIDSEGKALFCEIGARTGGGPVGTTYEKAFGVHLSKESLRGQSQQSLHLTTQPKQPNTYVGWIIFKPGLGTFQPPQVPCSLQGVDLTITLTPGTYCAALNTLGEAPASAVVEGSSPTEVAQKIEVLSAWWDELRVWQ